MSLRRLLLLDFIDPDLPIDGTQRSLIRAQAENEIASWKAHTVRSVGMLGAMASVVPLIMGVLGTAPWGPVVGGVLSVAALMMAMLVSGGLARRWIRPQVWRLLSQHGYDVCASCGYRLDPTLNTPCPECGTTRPSPWPETGSESSAR